MAKEIERRFLCNGEPVFLKEFDSFNIQQGYLFLEEDSHCRVRLEKSLTETKASMAVKFEDPENGRDEFDYEIPVNDAIEMLGKTDIKLSKTRKSLKFKEVHIDYDKFDNGMEWIEIEVPTLDYDIDVLPNMIKNCLLEEITHKDGYTNIDIALKSRG